MKFDKEVVNLKISIIVPVYNAEKYIKRCLNSLINQTYENLEIIIIDDGSKDKSLKIVKEYSKKDKRIKIIEKENTGVSDTRNIGINNATGEYIMFVDSDDWLTKDSCEKYSKFFEYNLDIIISKSFIIYPNKKEKSHSYIKKSKILSELEIEKLVSSIFIENNNYFSFIEAPWAKIFKTEFLKDNNIRFKKNLKIGEDTLLNFTAYNISNKIGFINNYTYNYYINELSVSNIFSKEIFDEYEKLYIEYKKLDFFNKYQHEFDQFIVKQLFKFLKKYYFNKNNKETYKANKKHFMQLLKKEEYKKAINEVTIKEINSSKKRIIYFLIKQRAYVLLALLYYIKG